MDQSVEVEEEVELIDGLYDEEDDEVAEPGEDGLGDEGLEDEVEDGATRLTPEEKLAVERCLKASGLEPSVASLALQAACAGRVPYDPDVLAQQLGLLAGAGGSNGGASLAACQRLAADLSASLADAVAVAINQPRVARLTSDELAARLAALAPVIGTEPHETGAAAARNACLLFVAPEQLSEKLDLLQSLTGLSRRQTALNLVTEYMFE